MLFGDNYTPTISPRCYKVTLPHLGPQVRDWSLLTGRGGGATNRRGTRQVISIQKEGVGVGKVSAMLKGGHTKF